jgi:Domain of unknown function (DUF5606)
MTLKEIASVSGKPGLYKVVKPTRTGIILETIDEHKKKTIANANSRVSLLQEISVYTTTEEGSILLEDVFKAIKKAKGDAVIETLSTEADLFSFLGSIIPDFDTEKVYSSDIKKMIAWYNTLSKFHPELLVGTEKKEAKADKEAKVEKTTKTKEAPKKAIKTAAPKVAAGKKGGGATAVKSTKRGA